MLDFASKLAIFSSYPELARKDVSLGRVNFHFEGSQHEKKTVGYHLHPNGNGFVYAGLIPGAKTDAKGFANIRDASEDELRRLIEASIASLSASADGPAGARAATAASGPAAGRPEPAEKTTTPGQLQPSRWTNAEGQSLRLTFEDELWYIFAGANLEAAFETYEEAETYMREEGFTPG